MYLLDRMLALREHRGSELELLKLACYFVAFKYEELTKIAA